MHARVVLAEAAGGIGHLEFKIWLALIIDRGARALAPLDVRRRGGDVNARRREEEDEEEEEETAPHRDSRRSLAPGPRALSDCSSSSAASKTFGSFPSRASRVVSRGF